MSAILKQNAVDIANAFEKYGLWKSSSGGSVSAEIKELWSGQQSTSGTLTLLDDYTNYDVIVSKIEPLENYPTQQSYDFMLKGGDSLTGGMCENTQYITQYRLMHWNGTSVYFSRDTNPSGWNVTLKKIYGIKFHNEIHEYSTEEKIVGKWIDGKTIYEKVIKQTITINSQNMNLNIDIPDFDFIQYYIDMSRVGTKEHIKENFNPYDKTYALGGFINYDNNAKLCLRVGENIVGRTYNLTMIFRYTKVS